MSESSGHANAVSTYSTGEQLYSSSVDGYLCLDLVTGDFEGLATGEFDGGTGRFANAHGNFESRFSGRNLNAGCWTPMPVWPDQRYHYGYAIPEVSVGAGRCQNWCCKRTVRFRKSPASVAGLLRLNQSVIRWHSTRRLRDLLGSLSNSHAVSKRLRMRVIRGNDNDWINCAGFFSNQEVKDKCTHKDGQQGCRPQPGYQEINDNVYSYAQAERLKYQNEIFHMPPGLWMKYQILIPQSLQKYCGKRLDRPEAA